MDHHHWSSGRWGEVASRAFAAFTCSRTSGFLLGCDWSTPRRHLLWPGRSGPPGWGWTQTGWRCGASAAAEGDGAWCPRDSPCWASPARRTRGCSGSSACPPPTRRFFLKKDKVRGVESREATTGKKNNKKKMLIGLKRRPDFGQVTLRFYSPAGTSSSTPTQVPSAKSAGPR